MKNFDKYSFYFKKYINKNLKIKFKIPKRFSLTSINYLNLYFQYIQGKYYYKFSFSSIISEQL